jgi:hypothetical protein
MGRVRPFLIADIPGVVALRRRAFMESSHRHDQSLAEYFERIFFANPWRGGELHSLVHTEDTGRITGFLGVVPRRALFEGVPIAAAVCTQFMVDPEARGLAGVQLVRRLLEGDQELTYADLSNDTSRRIWEGLGGSVSPIQSLTWTQPIRASRFRAGESARGLAGRALNFAARPAFAIVDSLTARFEGPRGLESIPLTPELVASHAGRLLGRVALHPAYDPRSTRWLLDQLELRREWGVLRGMALGDSAGEIAGWFLYYMNRGGTGEVVQLVAGPGLHAKVLQSLFAEAWRNGLVAVSGRGDPQLLPCLDPEKSRISRSGTWFLAHARRPEIMSAVERGDAFFSRLEGEWWMSF